jgi:hypothetical protein
MAFTHTKKGSFIKARIRIRSQTSGSGSDQKGPDSTGSGSATLLFRQVSLKKEYDELLIIDAGCSISIQEKLRTGT